MRKQLYPFLFFLLYSVFLLGQDSTVTTQPKDLNTNTLAYIQFNSIRDAASIGIQGRNISLVSFSNLPNPYFTEVHNVVTANGYVNKNKSLGIGVYYTLDNWSNLLYQNSLGLSFKTKVKNFHLGLGLERNTLFSDSSLLTFGNMFDTINGGNPNTPLSSSPKSFYFNFRPSVIYINKKVKIGCSLNHITEPSVALMIGNETLAMETNLNFSYSFNLTSKWSYTPMLNYFFSSQNQIIEIHNIITYSAPRKNHFLDLFYTDRKWLSVKYGINFNNRLKFFGQLNTPIYYANYFPFSAQFGIQYTFQTQNK